MLLVTWLEAPEDMKSDRPTIINPVNTTAMPSQWKYCSRRPRKPTDNRPVNTMTAPVSTRKYKLGYAHLLTC